MKLYALFIQKELLEKEKAIVEDDVEEIFSQKSHVKVIAMNAESLSNYQSQLKSIKIPVVDQEWISQCILHNRFLQPDRYSIRTDIQFVPERDEFKVELDFLEITMDKIESSDRMMNYLMNCVVYIPRMDQKEEQIQKRLIQLGGGAHLMTIIPNVTHIICDNFSEDQSKEFNKFSNVFIVSTRWLKDCMRFRTRVPEIEYLSIPVKKGEAEDK